MAENKRGNDNQRDFQEVEHTADWAFRIRARSLTELFVQAAEGIYRIGGVEFGAPTGPERMIHLEAGDAESLLVLWLNEILYLLEHDRLALVDIRLESLSDRELTAKAKTATVSATGKDIKAATYSGLKITEKQGIFEATVVLDV